MNKNNFNLHKQIQEFIVDILRKSLKEEDIHVIDYDSFYKNVNTNKYCAISHFVVDFDHIENLYTTLADEKKYLRFFEIQKEYDENDIYKLNILHEDIKDIRIPIIFSGGKHRSKSVNDNATDFEVYYDDNFIICEELTFWLMFTEKCKYGSEG